MVEFFEKKNTWKIKILLRVRRLKNNAVKIKSEWDVAKNIIEKLLKGM